MPSFPGAGAQLPQHFLLAGSQEGDDLDRWLNSLSRSAFSLVLVPVAQELQRQVHEGTPGVDVQEVGRLVPRNSPGRTRRRHKPG